MNTLVARNDQFPIAWVCSLCSLASFQKSESAYVKNLDDLHGDQLEEEQQRNPKGFQKWKDQMTKQAFLLANQKYSYDFLIRLYEVD
jgi:hypothetical protein